MGSILTLVNTLLGLLASFVAWGQARKAFNDSEAIIALHILRKAQKDIQIAKEIEDRVRSGFDADPTSVLKPDEFTRNDP